MRCVNLFYFFYIDFTIIIEVQEQEETNDSDVEQLEEVVGGGTTAAAVTTTILTTDSAAAVPQTVKPDADKLPTAAMERLDITEFKLAEFVSENVDPYSSGHVVCDQQQQSTLPIGSSHPLVSSVSQYGIQVSFFLLTHYLSLFGF